MSSEDRKSLKREEWIARYGGELPIGVALEEEIVEKRGRAPVGVLLEEKIKRSKKGVSTYEVIFEDELKELIFDGTILKMSLVNFFPMLLVVIFGMGLIISYQILSGTLPPPDAPVWVETLNNLGQFLIQILYLFITIPSAIMSTQWFIKDLRSGRLTLIFSGLVVFPFF